MNNKLSPIEEIVAEICKDFEFYGVDDDHNIVLQNNDTGEALLLTKNFEYQSKAVRKIYADIDRRAVDKESAINAKQAHQRAICQMLENHFTCEIMSFFGVVV